MELVHLLLSFLFNFKGGSITNDGIQALDTYILGIQQRNAQCE